jgi:tetratricopeptide (TPR) repeat protein
MESVEKYLIKFVNNPYNDEINYELAYAYECEEQYAAAVSYYLRCAEFTEDNVIAAEALIRLSLCINNQEGRDEKSLYFIKHAITASPNSIEPYYIASLYFSWRSGNIPEQRMWLDSYTYACMGINILENNLQTKPFKNSIGYDKHDIYYQKAWTGSKIGKIDEAREIYTHILSTFDINENVRENVENIKNELPEPTHPIISYSRDKIDKLKFKFENSDKIKSNFSQIYQDMFVLSMYNGKSDGAYLEIGAGHYDYGNNTYLLEKDFNWNGISIDINKHYTDIFNNNRENNCLCADATKIDYLELLDNNYGSTNIDYLQLDCDPPNITFDILTKIPFNKYKFGVITYEHDFYNDTTGKYREKSREFLKEKGYKLIAGNISPYKDNYPFEDWWIHPELIDENIYKLFERDEDIPINGEKYMLSNNKSIITSTHSVFEMDNQLTTINKSIITFGTDYLFKNQKIRFKQQAADINFFDSIIIEDEDTIKPLIKDHEDFIKNNQRGYGYWLWKPLIIKRQLEKMTNNDILFYLDSGSSIINNNIHKLNNYIDILQNKDIIVFDDRHRLNKQFTKRNVINEFNLNENILNSPIIEGGCII